MLNVSYVRKVSVSLEKVRSWCISYNLYDMGTQEEYDNFMKLCAKYDGTNQEVLREIAYDVIDKTDDDELSGYGFGTYYEIVAWVMTVFEQECCYQYYIAKEWED